MSLNIKKSLTLIVIILSTILLTGCHKKTEPLINKDTIAENNAIAKERDKVTKENIDKIVAGVADKQKGIESINNEIGKEVTDAKNNSLSLKLNIAGVEQSTNTLSQNAQLEDVLKSNSTLNNYLLGMKPFIDQLKNNSVAIDKNIDHINILNNNLTVKNSEIKALQDKIAELSASYGAVSSSIVALTKDKELLGKEITRLNEENKKLKEENTKLLYTILTCIVVLGILCMVAAGVMLYLSMTTNAIPAKLPFSLGLGGFLSVVIAATIMMYFKQIAIIGAIAFGGVTLVLAIVGGIIYARRVKHVITNKSKELEETNKALVETVQTTEATKPYLTEEAKKKIFGTGAEPGSAHVMQSESTISKVNEIRNNMKKYWEPTVKIKQ